MLPDLVRTRLFARIEPAGSGRSPLVADAAAQILHGHVGVDVLWADRIAVHD